MQPSPCIARRRAALTAVALVAIVLAQMLGLMHRIVHAHPAPAWGSGIAWTQAPALSADPGGDWLQALFGGHRHDGDCDSFDRLTHCDALQGVAAAALPTLPPLAPACLPAPGNPAVPCAGPRARAPPALS